MGWWKGTVRAVKYFEEARTLWQTYVPRSGQAATIQGEDIRSVEKLRDEAQRNGNINWSKNHEKLVAFIRKTLVESRLFDPAAEAEIEADTERLLDADHPETTDEPFDRLTDRIVEWSRAQPGPVPHTPDPHLHI